MEQRLRSRMGSSYLTVTISDDKENPLRLNELSDFSVPDEVDEVAPVSWTSVTAKTSNSSGTITLIGTTGGYMDIQGLELYSGRFLKKTDTDNNSYVVVITKDTATELLGRADATDEKSLEPAKNALTELLLERFGQDEDAFSVVDQSEIMEAMSNVTNTMSLMIGGIVAISLLVGGIGIMNIMLVSVTERTREIGIRKAIGAKRGTIMLQFLMEALLVSLMGCVAGIGLAWVILKVAGIVMKDSMSFAMDMKVVWVSVGFSALIGVVFGLYPANKAASKKPIEALRYSG